MHSFAIWIHLLMATPETVKTGFTICITHMLLLWILMLECSTRPPTHPSASSTTARLDTPSTTLDTPRPTPPATPRSGRS